MQTESVPALPVDARRSPATPRRCAACCRAGQGRCCVARGILIGMALAGVLWTIFFVTLLLLT
ncbi:MAG TPA: hypothetical protein VGM87_18505 [Roseomonas sp.]|jgi:hypothetical protein